MDLLANQSGVPVMALIKAINLALLSRPIPGEHDTDTNLSGSWLRTFSAA